VRTYAQVIESGDVILADGAQGTRLHLETGLDIDPAVDVGGFASDGRSAVLRALSGEYVAIAAALELPIQIDAVTFRLNPDRLGSVGRFGELTELNRRCVEAAAANRRIFTDTEIYVAGVLCPRVDMYDPAETPDQDESAEYHHPQAEALAAAGADVLYGETVSTGSEAVGLARAMGATGCPYAVGPIIDRDGHLPDGTSLEAVIAAVDANADPAPLHFFINCTHPVVALAGLRAVRDRGGDTSRVIGLKANGSDQPPAELDGIPVVHCDPPLQWTAAMRELRNELGLRLLGGCCGTDSRHILALALQLSGLVD
jgi:S-methylmethionine-dependent homocysteine/selenocysteine methylase